MLSVGSVQVAIGLIFAGLALGVVAVLLLVAQHAKGPALPYAVVRRPGYAIRSVWFVLVLATMGVTVVASLFFLPYPTAAAARDATPVTVTAQQYAWQLSATTFKVGQKVDFAVTSSDVNHGFGLYGPRGALLIQVQAMPTYTNHLVFTFPTPGTYTIRCLEYCGLAHDVMQTTLMVTP